MEEVISQFTTLGEAITTLNNLKIYPPLVCKGVEVIFINELLWNVSKLNLDIFMTLLKFSIKSLVTKKPIMLVSEFCTTVRTTLTYVV